MDASGLSTPKPPPLGLRQLLTVHDETDEHGRLLLEDSASPHARTKAESAGIKMDSEPCPYQDTPSRFGGPMNASAFAALRAETAGVLDGFAWLTRLRLAEDPSLAGTVPLLYDVSYLGLTLPLVLLHRAQEPFPSNGAVPAVAASIFKASRGLFTVAIDLRNRGHSQSERIAGSDIVHFADDRGHLVRRQPARVCAAPTRLIERTLCIILGGEGANAGASRLPAWVEYPTLWSCYRLQDELSEALSTFRYVLNTLAPSADAITLAHFSGRTVPGTSGTLGQLTEAMVAHANSVQVQLNRTLGRQDRPPTLTTKDLFGLL